MEDIGAKLKEIRIANGYSQARLAEVSGVSLRTIKSIEAGGWDGRISILKQLTNAMNFKIVVLFESMI